MHSVRDTPKGGLPHSEIPGSQFASNSPGLIAGSYVLLRLPTPRHSPCALVWLDRPARRRRPTLEQPRHWLIEILTRLIPHANPQITPQPARPLQSTPSKSIQTRPSKVGVVLLSSYPVVKVHAGTRPTPLALLPLPQPRGGFRFVKTRFTSHWRGGGILEATNSRSSRTTRVSPTFRLF